jgi:hypothetical protein
LHAICQGSAITAGRIETVLFATAVHPTYRVQETTMSDKRTSAATSPKLQVPAKKKFPTSFGVFSPTGYVLMVFADDANAEKARRALIDRGFNENDVTHYNRDEVLKEFEESEEHASDPLQIGQDVDKVDRYLEFAKQGCGFVVVRAPEEERSKLAVSVVRPFNLKFAEKYNRLTLEELA